MSQPLMFHEDVLLQESTLEGWIQINSILPTFWWQPLDMYLLVATEGIKSSMSILSQYVESWCATGECLVHQKHK